MSHRRTALVAALALALPGAAAAATGSQLFATSGCTGCHTLAAAGATGTGGPNLDQLRPSESAVARQVTYGGPGMPAFGSSLGAANVSILATWVSSVAGSGTSASTAAAAAGGQAAGSLAPRLAASEVRRIQQDLATLGYFHHVVTGFYGPVTKAAVAAFQRAAGLKVDGLWGPNTAAAVTRRLG
jgi:mono/diheme cytochrome c family protein